MGGLHPQGLEQISLISHKEATQVQHCSASFGTEHSCFTGGLQRRAWGGIRGRLEMQTEHSHSFVNGLQLCFQQAGLQHLWRQPRTGSQTDKSSYLTPSKQPLSAPLSEQQEEHKFHTSLFPERANLSGDPF